MREKVNWWRVADGNWHRVAKEQAAYRFGRVHGYRVQIVTEDGERFARVTPRTGAPDEELRQRLADAHDGRYPEVPSEHERDLRPAQWFILTEAGRNPEGIPPVKHLHGATVASLQNKYLTSFHQSLTPTGLRVLGREVEALHLESVGAECLADLTDRTFRPL